MSESLYEELVKVKWGVLSETDNSIQWFPHDYRFVMYKSGGRDNIHFVVCPWDNQIPNVDMKKVDKVDKKLTFYIMYGINVMEHILTL